MADVLTFSGKSLMNDKAKVKLRNTYFPAFANASSDIPFELCYW
jgi:hypothetical protein